MPGVDIDPAALSRSESIPNGITTPSATTKPLITTSTTTQKAAKAAPSAPRVDLEPLYTSLKTSIGDNWGDYKDAVSRFILGHLSHAELTRQTSSFILIDPHRTHLHNTLICAIHANINRDPPEQGVAPWVSTNDKPTAVPKPVSGDKAKLRLKHEAMLLSRGARDRIKSVNDDAPSPISHPLRLHTTSKRPYTTTTTNPTTTSLGTPISSTAPTNSASTSLNRDLEIRRRYNHPLACEIHDLPASASLAERVLPICYEEGLAGGSANPTGCADLLLTATELFVKEVLTGLLARTGPPPRGPNTSQPAASSSAKIAPPGSHTTNGTNASPRATRHVAPTKPPTTNGHTARPDPNANSTASTNLSTRSDTGPQGDLGLAWELGDAWLSGMMPWLGEQRALAAYDRITEDGEAYDGDNHDDDGGGDAAAPPSQAHDVNGVEQDAHGMDVDGAVNGSAAHDGGGEDAYAIDESAWHWQGGGRGDRLQLDRLLDDCLVIGQ
ncbi:MAG: transcriptional coactivator hfi1/ADA1 [Chrysothrix sp. TS-e1954]|nr:MAG: transcriptional coactivator hfi1/ADA1 [Chrysothrix sp. TS-e1954]